jgi:hypothetical protein
MSETRRPPYVPANTVGDDAVKFQFPKSMSFDPMSIHAQAARTAARKAGSVAGALSVRNRPRIELADMSETAARGTVVGLTLYGLPGRFTFSSLEFSIAIAFDGRGESNQ